MPLERTAEATAFTDPRTLSVVFQMNDLDLSRNVRVTVHQARFSNLTVAPIHCPRLYSIETRLRVSPARSSTGWAAGRSLCARKT